MIAVIQRVNSASVYIKKQIVAKIAKGVLILICFEKNDKNNIDKLINDLEKMKIFSDGKCIGLTIKEAKAEILVVPEFTLATKFNNNGRPNFSGALESKLAKNIFETLCKKIKTANFKIVQGQFGQNMQVMLENDGPVTFILNIN